MGYSIQNSEEAFAVNYKEDKMEEGTVAAMGGSRNRKLNSGGW